MLKKTFLKWRPSAILNFKNFHIWSSGCQRVPNLLLCRPTYQISSKSDDFSLSYGDFTICKMADLCRLEFSGSNNRLFEKPMYDFLYRSSIGGTVAQNCLVFEQIAFLYTQFGDRQTDGRTDGQTDGLAHRIKVQARYSERRRKSCSYNVHRCN